MIAPEPVQNRMSASGHKPTSRVSMTGAGSLHVASSTGPATAEGRARLSCDAGSHAYVRPQPFGTDG
jgi:hypothetical protein